MRHTNMAVVGVLSLALALAAASTAVAAAPPDGPDPSASTSGVAGTPLALANPGVSEDVIAQLPEVVQQSDVKIAPDFVPGSPLVYPDGTSVEGQSAEATAQVEALMASGDGSLGAACNRQAWSGVVGCGNGGGGDVVRGNVLGNPAARTMSQAVVAGFRVDWISG